MFHQDRIIAVVPARGGSQAMPRKNLALLGGKPLVTWSVDVALKSEYVDRVIVSTDDDEIAETGVGAGAEVYKRPAHLATDSSLVIDALRDLWKRLREEGESAEVMVLLEPTSPLRLPSEIDECIVTLIGKDLDSVATFREAMLHPHRAWKLDDGRMSYFLPNVDPWQPRQKLSQAYQLNGAVYCFRTAVLASEQPGLFGAKSGYVIMPAERSVDIDSEVDLLLAEALLHQRGF